MPTATVESISFVEKMNEKFKDAGEFSKNKFFVAPGKKFDKICQGRNVQAESVHCFIERETGYVYKAASWAKPATGVRYLSVDAAVENADLYGSYLYSN